MMKTKNLSIYLSPRNKKKLIETLLKWYSKWNHIRGFILDFNQKTAKIIQL
jgi:hypothetical protein